MLEETPSLATLCDLWYGSLFIVIMIRNKALKSPKTEQIIIEDYWDTIKITYFENL